MHYLGGSVLIWAALVVGLLAWAYCSPKWYSLRFWPTTIMNLFSGIAGDSSQPPLTARLSNEIAHFSESETPTGGGNDCLNTSPMWGVCLARTHVCIIGVPCAPATGLWRVGVTGETLQPASKSQACIVPAYTYASPSSSLYRISAFMFLNRFNAAKSSCCARRSSVLPASHWSSLSCASAAAFWASAVSFFSFCSLLPTSSSFLLPAFMTTTVQTNARNNVAAIPQLATVMRLARWSIEFQRSLNDISISLLPEDDVVVLAMAGNADSEPDFPSLAFGENCAVSIFRIVIRTQGRTY